MTINPTSSTHATDPRPLTVRSSRVDHRDGAGHLDPAYAARLRERTSRRARGDEARELVRGEVDRVLDAWRTR